MRRYTAYMSGERFLADKKSIAIHDLEHEKNDCLIDEIIRLGNELPFKRLEDAIENGYSKCSFCFGKNGNNFDKNYNSI